MNTITHKEACRAWLDGKKIEYTTPRDGSFWIGLKSVEIYEGGIPAVFVQGDYLFRIRPVQTTNNLSSKDSGEASKEVASTSSQPEPVSTVMPEEVNHLLEVLDRWKDSPLCSVRLTLIQAAEPSIRAAYQRIADLEKLIGDDVIKDYSKMCMEVVFQRSEIADLKAELTQLKSQLAAMREAEYTITACYFPHKKEVELTWKHNPTGEEVMLTAKVTEKKGNAIAQLIPPCVYLIATSMNASTNQDPRPAPECKPPQDFTLPPPQYL